MGGSVGVRALGCHWVCPLGGPQPFDTVFLLSSQLQQKAVASEIFKGKKDNYPQSVPRLFISTRLGEPSPQTFHPSSLPALSCLLALPDFLLPVLVSGTEEISPRVLQALGSEPIQVGTHHNSRPYSSLPRGQSSGQGSCPGSPPPCPAPHTVPCL